jgi:Lon protease-like protein
VNIVLPLRDVVLFPGMFRAVHLQRDAALEAIERVVESGEPVVALHQIVPAEEDAFTAAYHPIGVIAQVLRVIRMPDGTVRVLLEGMERVRVRGPHEVRDGVITCKSRSLPVEIGDRVRFEALARELDLRFRDYMVGTGISPNDHDITGARANEAERLIDQVLANLDLTYEERVRGLVITDPIERLEYALEQVAVGLGQQKVSADVNQRMQSAMDKSQREYQLKEQLKAIRAELGDAAGGDAEADVFEKRILESAMPAEAKEEARRRSLGPREGQGTHPRVPRGAQAQSRGQGADPLLRGASRRRQDLARRSIAHVARPQVRARLARRHARRSRDPRPSPHLHRRAARSDHPGPAARGVEAIRSSSSTRSTSSAPTSAATRRRRCSRCSIPSRTRRSAITTSTCRSISPRCCSSPPPTCSTRSRGAARPHGVLELPGYTEEEKLKIATRAPDRQADAPTTASRAKQAVRGRRGPRSHPRLHARGRCAQPRTRAWRVVSQGRAPSRRR